MSKIRKEIERQRIKTIKLKSDILDKLKDFEEEKSLRDELEEVKKLNLSEKEESLYSEYKKYNPSKGINKIGKQIMQSLKSSLIEWKKRNNEKRDSLRDKPKEESKSFWS